MVRASKKIVAVLLALLMVFSLAACGNKAKETKSDNETDTEKATPTQAADEEEEVAAATATPTAVPEKYEAFDFGQRTLKVGIWWDYYYTSDHTAITDNPAVANTETAQMQLENVRRIEKKYNCKIQFINLGWQGIQDSINTSVAAGTPECDIYLTDVQFGMPAVLNGLAQDLSKIALDGSDLFGNQVIIKPYEGFGGTYFFTEQGLPVNGIYIGYNATMMQDLGLEDPQELYKNGQWTWDKFAELAQKGTKDTDNDGTTDIYGYGGIFTNFVHGLVLNNGGNIAGTEKEGLSSESAIEAFELVDRLYNKDKSARPWNGDDWDDNLLAWSDGKVMMWTAQAWSLKQEADAAVKEGAELPFEYHVVPYPIGPHGDKTTSYSPLAGNWYIIPVGVEEPGKVLQVFEEFLNWFNYDTEYRDDPTWFESCFQSEEDVEIAKACGSNIVADPYNCLAPYFDFGGAIWWPVVVNHDKTVAQSVEASKTTLQDALDYFYSKK